MRWMKDNKGLAIFVLIALAVPLHISAAFVDIREAATAQTLSISNCIQIAEIGVGGLTAVILKRWI